MTAVRNQILNTISWILIFTFSTVSYASESEKLVHQIDFESEEYQEKLPNSILVLSGKFTIEQEHQNHVLKLHESPLFTHGLLLTGVEASETISITARIRSENRRRSMPRFGVGLNGIGGYKLRVTPTKQALELYKGNEVIQQTEIEWTSGEWTWLRLEVKPLDDSKWQISGSAWCDCESEPMDWMLTYVEEDNPLEGPPSLWGTPYSSKPIFYDDIVIQSSK